MQKWEVINVKKVCLWVCERERECVFVCVGICECKCVCECAYVSVCMWVCMWLCECMCVWVCVCMCVCVEKGKRKKKILKLHLFQLRKLLSTTLSLNWINVTFHKDFITNIFFGRERNYFAEEIFRNIFFCKKIWRN